MELCELYQLDDDQIDAVSGGVRASTKTAIGCAAAMAGVAVTVGLFEFGPADWVAFAFAATGMATAC